MIEFVIRFVHNEVQPFITQTVIYECAKRMKFLFQVLYGSSQRHSNSEKITFKIDTNLYDHLRPS